MRHTRIAVAAVAAMLAASATPVPAASAARDLSRGALACHAHAPLARTISRLAGRGLAEGTARRMIGFTAGVEPALNRALSDTVDGIYRGNAAVAAIALGGAWERICANYFRKA